MRVQWAYAHRICKSSPNFIACRSINACQFLQIRRFTRTRCVWRQAARKDNR